MTRFILTLKQATQLVFTALKTMVGGEVFIPKIKPLKITDLAEVLIASFNPKNSGILYIGLRPGEKINETLISAAESLRVVNKKNHFILLPEIDLQHIGHVYKANTYVKGMMNAYSSDKGPFLTRAEIKEILKDDGVI